MLEMAINFNRHSAVSGKWSLLKLLQVFISSRLRDV